MNGTRSFKFLPLLLACGALTASAAALAGPHHFGPRADGDLSGLMFQRLVRGLEQLNLNEAQRDNIHALLGASREAMAENREAARDMRRLMHEIVTAETLDEAALAELAEQEGALAAERVTIAATTAHAVLAELDESQRAELEAMREERLERRAERRERRQSYEGDG